MDVYSDTWANQLSMQVWEAKYAESRSLGTLADGVSQLA